MSNFAGSNALGVVQQNWAVQTWGQQREYQYIQYSADNVYNYQNALGVRTKAWKGNGTSVSTGEIQTNRADILYGTFRMSAKIPTTPGVCFGFFTYYSDSQETDIEFLTNDTNSKHTVHYTNQPRTTSASSQEVVVSNDLTAFNVHRLDWLPTQTMFYLNNKQMRTISLDVPNTPSRMLANVWSDGDPEWSMGPPKADAIATIQYINLYFNSTSYNETAFNSACKQSGKPAVCQV